MSERRAALSLVVSLTLVLLLAACVRNSTPPIPTPTAPREISGTVAGWTGGEAVVRAESPNPENGAPITIAEETISADGSFSLTLPVEGAALADALETADGEFFCPDYGVGDVVSTIEFTPGLFETVLIGNYFYVYDSTSGERLGIISPETTPENNFVNAYASSDATVKGDCVTTYGEESSTLRVDLDYNAGWNAVFGTESGSVFSISTGPFPVDTNPRWTYMSEIPPPTDPPSPPCEPDTPECAPPTPTPPTPEMLSGTMEQWIGEDAVIRALSYNFETDEQVVSAEGIVSDDGSFNITLPAEEGVADALFTIDESNFCATNQTGGGDIRSTVEVMPSSIGFANLGLLVYESAYSSENVVIGDVLATDNNYEVVINFYYAASDATIRGDCITTLSADFISTDAYDLDLKAGWNKVMSVSTAEGRSLSTEPVPEDIRWSFIER